MSKWVIRNGPMVWPREKAMREISSGWGGWWKVTGDYSVQMSRRVSARVIRVSACVSGGSCTRHYSTREFLRLFDTTKRRRAHA